MPIFSSEGGGGGRFREHEHVSLGTLKATWYSDGLGDFSNNRNKKQTFKKQVFTCSVLNNQRQEGFFEIKTWKPRIFKLLHNKTLVF